MNKTDNLMITAGGGVSAMAGSEYSTPIGGRWGQQVRCHI